MLSGSNLVMLCLGKDAKLPKLLVKVCHIFGDSRLYNTEIVIVHFLTLRRFCTEKGSAGKFQILALLVHFLINKEVFLLRTYCCCNSCNIFSSASPPYEQKAVGMQRVLPLINAYDVGSHAVYPLASNVARSPPEGKDDASGSPLMSSLPENSMITLPSGAGEMKLSCFSAVIPVSGWNQCVK